jgi:hypothetical protein
LRHPHVIQFMPGISAGTFRAYSSYLSPNASRKPAENCAANYENSPADSFRQATSF